MLPVSEDLQAAIKLKPELTLITEINCGVNRSKVWSGAVLFYKSEIQHTANTTITACGGTAGRVRGPQDQLQNSQQAVRWHLDFTLSPLLLQREEILFPEALFAIASYCCRSHPDCGASVAAEPTSERGKGALFALISALFQKPGQDSGKHSRGSEYQGKSLVMSSPGQWYYKDSRTPSSIPSAATEHTNAACHFSTLLPFSTCCTVATQSKPCSLLGWCCPSWGLCTVSATGGPDLWPCCNMGGPLDPQDFHSFSDFRQE